MLSHYRDGAQHRGRGALAKLAFQVCPGLRLGLFPFTASGRNQGPKRLSLPARSQLPMTNAVLADDVSHTLGHLGSGPEKLSAIPGSSSLGRAAVLCGQQLPWAPYVAPGKPRIVHTRLARGIVGREEEGLM